MWYNVEKKPWNRVPPLDYWRRKEEYHFPLSSILKKDSGRSIFRTSVESVLAKIRRLTIPVLYHFVDLILALAIGFLQVSFGTWIYLILVCMTSYDITRSKRFKLRSYSIFLEISFLPFSMIFNRYYETHKRTGSSSFASSNHDAR